MKIRLNLLAQGFSMISDKISSDIGKFVSLSSVGEKLHVGDIVLLKDSKEAIVTESGIYSRKMIADGIHVDRIVKKFSSLEVGDTYLKGLVEII